MGRHAERLGTHTRLAFRVTGGVTAGPNACLWKASRPAGTTSRHACLRMFTLADACRAQVQEASEMRAGVQASAERMSDPANIETRQCCSESYEGDVSGCRPGVFMPVREIAALGSVDDHRDDAVRLGSCLAMHQQCTMSATAPKTVKWLPPRRVPPRKGDASKGCNVIVDSVDHFPLSGSPSMRPSSFRLVLDCSYRCLPPLSI